MVVLLFRALNSLLKGPCSRLAMSSNSKPSFKAVDSIIKSQEDNRSYRGLILENGLKVLLVSDATTDKAAASMDVQIGHMSDPKDLQGLAHFCEHMLFLGTEKYPDENDYQKFLSQHGGSSNAYTSQSHTNYHFEVASKNLKPSLDRFAQFFVSPLFNESAVDREVKAVNSEHEKNIATDAWRLGQLERSLADPEHDFHKFGTGNIQTLGVIPKAEGVSVRDELLKFHDTWYSSNIMALSVLGAESLDELQDMVLDFFVEVKDKGVEAPSWPNHPFLPDDNKTVTYVVPVKDIRNLNVTFPIMDLRPYYKTNPGHYLGNLIGHEGKGSLLSELKARGWVNSLVGGEKAGAAGFGFFIINVDLTETGIEHVDDIISLMFQYLNMLRAKGPQKWLFEEGRDIDIMIFRFKDKENPRNYVSNLAHCMHYYPLEEVLYSEYCAEEWKPELIEMVLEKLRPEFCRIAIVSQSFKDKCLETESWYGTKYTTEKIPEEKLQAWNDPSSINGNLTLPEKNEFIPTNFDLVEKDPKHSEFPTIIKETPLTRLWFKQDDQFLLPKATLDFEFRSPVAYFDPHHVNLSHMFMTLFKDELNEYAYAASLANLVYSVYNTKYGINLSIRGYSQKQPILLEKIVCKLANFKVNPERFVILKEVYMRNLQNFKMEQPHSHCVYHNSAILTEQNWQKEELLEAMDELTVEAVQDFIPRLLSKLHIEILACGNVTENDALKIAEIVEDKLKVTKSLKPAQLVKDREIQLEENTHSIFQTTNDCHTDSCIEIYYQCGSQDPKSNMLLELVAQLIKEPCFNILRTQEQLGYIVFSGLRRASGVQGLSVIVQSDRHPEFLENRIEAWLSCMEKFLEEMPEEEFVRNRQALADRRLEKPKKLTTLVSKYWTEILCHQYNFDRDNLEVAVLKEITKEETLEFFKKNFGVQSKKRKKLSCRVVSIAEGGAGAVEAEDLKTCVTDNGDDEGKMKMTLINDRIKFKSTLPLYPRAKPFVDPSNLHRRNSSK